MKRDVFFTVNFKGDRVYIDYGVTLFKLLEKDSMPRFVRDGLNNFVFKQNIFQKISSVLKSPLKLIYNFFITKKEFYGTTRRKGETPFTQTPIYGNGCTEPKGQPQDKFQKLNITN